MALKWTTTDQASEDHGKKMIVYGESGSGKTTLLGTLDPATTVILSAENGLLALRSKKIAAIKIESVEDLTEAFRWLQTPEASVIKNVGLDSISEIGEVVLANAKKLVKDPRQAYGELIEKMTILIKGFRDLPGKNVIFLAKLERFKDDVTGIVTCGPFMPGTKLGPQIPYLFDEVFKLDVATDPATKASYRFLQTAKDSQNVCKDRSGTLEMYEAADLNHILTKMSQPIHTTQENTGA